MATVLHTNDSRALFSVAIGARDIGVESMKSLAETYMNLASYCYRMAKSHADQGDFERANNCLVNARAYDSFAVEVK